MNGRIIKKRKVDRVRRSTSTVDEEQRKALEQVEEEIKQKHRDSESLKASKSRMKRKYKARIRELEKQLQVKKAQFEEENT